ncbi:NmrA family transcriptional regulator [Rhodococcus sp. 06-235-1A]|uniref:NAD(P)-dependent oxidoreductase n=1 Tax=Rhodococcus sp. 06-235-1A TaxID=2022508 RepID=UPI000B9ACF20|nr:NAD(P)H-binding protein [Rhodococcus sp. 06-235-1A]OZC95432.1 NmrA family transcriptional regulator [Rhodococcus sp. 06-235-1A]
MNITVFGATGVIGALTVDRLLEAGHTVTAHARNPAKVPQRWADRVRLVVGELSDSGSVDRAVHGADVVVSALGPLTDRKISGLPLTEGVRHILAAMSRHGITRYVGHGTPSVLDPHENPTMMTRFVSYTARTFIRRAYDEMTAMSAAIMSSGLDWTIVRFIRPTNGDATGTVRSGFFGTDKLGFAITRADIAAFTAAQVDDTRYIGRAPAISN